MKILQFKREPQMTYDYRGYIISRVAQCSYRIKKEGRPLTCVPFSFPNAIRIVDAILNSPSEKASP